MCAKILKDMRTNSNPFTKYFVVSLNNYKISVQTQYVISIMLYSYMFRPTRVIIRLPLIIFKVYKVTQHIWGPMKMKLVWIYNVNMLGILLFERDPKCAQLLCTP